MAVVEEDVNIDIRHVVDVTVGYNDNRRRGRGDENGQGNVDADIHVNPCSAHRGESHGEHQ